MIDFGDRTRTGSISKWISCWALKSIMSTNSFMHTAESESKFLGTLKNTFFQITYLYYLVSLAFSIYIYYLYKEHRNGFFLAECRYTEGEALTQNKNKNIGEKIFFSASEKGCIREVLASVHHSRPEMFASSAEESKDGQSKQHNVY